MIAEPQLAPAPETVSTNTAIVPPEDTLASSPIFPSSKEDAMRILGAKQVQEVASPQSQVNQIVDSSSSLLPSSTEEARKMFGVQDPSGASSLFPVGQSVKTSQAKERVESQYVAEESKKLGVQVDPNDEVSFWNRFMADLRPDNEQKLQYLADTFGKENVEIDQYGDPLIKVKDKVTGKPKAIPLNAHRMTVNDLSSILSAAPQAAAAYLSLRAGRQATPSLAASSGVVGKVGSWLAKHSQVRDIVMGATGAETMGGLQEVAAGGKDISTITSERAKQIPIDMAVDSVMFGMTKPIRYLSRGVFQGEWRFKSPFQMARSSVNKVGIEGAQEIAKETGIEIPLSFGERSGWPFAAQMEEYMRKNPLGAKKMAEMFNVQSERFRQFQEFMLQPNTLQDDLAVGEKLASNLRAVKQEAAGELAKTAEQTTEQLGGKVLGAVDTAVGATGPVEFAEAGETIRKGLADKLSNAEAIQSQMRDEIAVLPGGSGRIFTSKMSGLSNKAKSLLKQLPAAEKTVEEIVVDQYGNPTIKQTAKTELETLFIPSKTRARIEDLTNPTKKFGLNDLISIRAQIYEDLGSKEAVSEQGVHWLSEAGKMITSSIDDSISNLPDGQLKIALKAANEHYKKEVVPFKSSGISDLFTKEEQKGFVGPTEIVSRLTRDPDAYLKMVKMVGQGSPEHVALKRSIADDLIRNSSDDIGGNIISADALRENMRKMASNAKTRPIYMDVFGKKVPGSTLEEMSLAQSIGSGKIPREQVEQLIAEGKLNSQSLKGLAQAWKKDAELYKNNLIRAVGTGELDTAALSPDELLHKFIDTGTSKDVEKVWAVLSKDPDLQDQVRRKTIEELFSRAQRSMEPEDIVSRLKGGITQPMSAAGLYEAMGDSEMRKKLEIVLGTKDANLVKSATKVLSVMEWREREGGGTGLLTRGSAVGGVLRLKPSGLSKEIVQFARLKAAAWMLSKPGIWQIVTSTYSPPEYKKLLAAVVTSEPFIESVLEDVADDTKAAQVLHEAKRMAGLLKNNVAGDFRNQQQPAAPRP